MTQDQIDPDQLEDLNGSTATTPGRQYSAGSTGTLNESTDERLVGSTATTPGRQYSAGSAGTLISEGSAPSGDDQRKRSSRRKVTSLWKEDVARARMTSEVPPTVSAFRSITSAPSSRIGSSFIQGKRRGELLEQATGLERLRIQLGECLDSTVADIVLTVVIVVDVVLAGIEIDLQSAGDPIPPYIVTIMPACFVVYVLELLLRLLVKSSEVCKDSWLDVLDFAVIIVGALDYIVQASRSEIELGFVRVLRLFRILRLLRIFRRVGFFKELRKLIRMTSSCLKTLFWSFTFVFALLTFWSMVAVQLVSPLVKDLYAQGKFGDCEHCETMMATVMKTNLFFFKLTVAGGDEWGAQVEPVIFNHPWTACIFIPALLSICFGVLQLVIAVVVDEFADKRANDFTTLAREMDEELEKDMIRLTETFRQIDLDRDGEISLEELMSGAERVEEFRNRLRVMDIDAADLEKLFQMLDEDGSGTIDPEEFLNALSRWLHDSRTASRFVKYELSGAIEKQDQMLAMSGQMFETIMNIGSRLQYLEDTIEGLSDEMKGARRRGRSKSEDNRVLEKRGKEPFANCLGHSLLRAEEALSQALSAAREVLPQSEFACLVPGLGMIPGDKVSRSSKTRSTGSEKQPERAGKQGSLAQSNGFEFEEIPSVEVEVEVEELQGGDVQVDVLTSTQQDAGKALEPRREDSITVKI